MNAEVAAIVIGLGVIALVTVAARRMSRSGPGGGVSSGIASALADVDAMLQPQHPTADVIRRAKEQEEEREDDGDPPDPKT